MNRYQKVIKYGSELKFCCVKSNHLFFGCPDIQREGVYLSIRVVSYYFYELCKCQIYKAITDNSDKRQKLTKNENEEQLGVKVCISWQI